MAEIRIERKRRNLGWLWLLLALLIVAALAWYFLSSGRSTPAPAAAPPTTGALERVRPEHRVAKGLGGSPQGGYGLRHFGGSYGTQG